MRKLVLIAAAGTAAIASAQPIDGVPTIFLDAPTQNWGAPMNVAYHPGFDQYYAGGGGFASNTGNVYDAAGNLLLDGTIVVDLRSLNYNPNTGDLEVATFAANGGGNNRGLLSIGLDGGGLYDGTANLELVSLPGLIDGQTVPGYDPANDVFYSGASGNSQVNVVRRSDGSLDSTFNLDLSGGRLNGTNTIGYDPDNDWIIVGDAANDQVHVFDTSGNFIGTSNIPGDIPATWGFGYTNGQVFAFDAALGGWQGFRIKADDGCPADLDGDGDADSDDFFDYLDAFASDNLPVCDIDGDGDCDSDDFFGYLDLFAQGC